jgi:hypothetical protein
MNNPPRNHHTRLDAADRSRCFTCALQADFTNATYAGCADCFKQWEPSAAAEQLMPASSKDACLACVESAETPPAAKGACGDCVRASRNASRVQECIKCLQTQRRRFDHESSMSCVNEE